MTQGWEAKGLYEPEDEHDACGVGMIASIKGETRRDIVELGIEALKAVWHRGAVNADGKTGDGAGIHLQIPDRFFRDYISDFGAPLSNDQPFAIGMIFLPRRNYEAQEQCRMMVESAIIRLGYRIRGWRQVPINPSAIGEQADSTRPEIAQIIILGNEHEEEAKFERNLYLIRRRIENQVLQQAIRDFHICSLSCRSIVFKGLFQAEQLAVFYPDLQDPRIESNCAIFHQRFSTNTAPKWDLAQPFTMLAHNGEINTVRGNTQWMRTHEAFMHSPLFGQHIEDIKPVIPPGVSDTAALNAVMELLVKAGRSLPLSKLIMIPPAWTRFQGIPESHKALFSYCNCVMAPWDGPAAIAASDGEWALVGCDRNGLRPLRYSITDDGLLLAGSESGMVPMDSAKITEYGRLGPGEMVGIHLLEGRLYYDQPLKDKLAEEYPYEEWRKGVVKIATLPATGTHFATRFTEDEVKRRQIACGHTREDLDLVIAPMAESGKESIGSMGDDTSIAVLAKHYRGMHQFFRQNFSQVTNPPIDPIRERNVMSLLTRIGNKENILLQEEEQTQLVLLQTPILLNADMEALEPQLEGRTQVLDTTFPVSSPQETMALVLEGLLKQTDHHFEEGRRDFILTDAAAGEARISIPMILAVGALHSYMVATGRRKQISIFARSAECFDTHHAAVLIGVGASGVNPYLSESWLVKRYQAGRFRHITMDELLINYRDALSDGLLKIMSKMGISVVSSYRGGKNFEAVGLSRALVAEYFPGLSSRISGIGLPGLEARVRELHRRAYEPQDVSLSIGGFYLYRHEGERHADQGKDIHLLQQAVEEGNFEKYQAFAQSINGHVPMMIRDLLDFRSDREPISVDQVESVTEIRKRFVVPAMSIGALGPEAHEVLAIAANRMGMLSNSGEGGEDPSRFKPKQSGDNANSTIKQVASGRFGVTAEYLNACREIQIKVAQGAKPGEGGQLPGFKVNEMIARLRHATPGVTLISPPPHHDIYSIEDLAQLIYDLKQINPEALVSVKLVSQSGVGTIASGVVKAHADKIVVAGHSGGTGASPLTSLKFAGAPFEMGIAETHQVLTLNGLRSRVTLQTDGGIRTGRDIVMAALLGAEEFALGTISLIALGCLLVRQCHSNTCPVGICTQDEALRAKFEGTVERVINLYSFIAEDVRQILASLGYTSLRDIVGRTELLQQINVGGEGVDTIDLGPLLVQPDKGEYRPREAGDVRNEVEASLDEQMIADARTALEKGEKTELSYMVNNTHRTVGTRLSSFLVRNHKVEALKTGHVTVQLQGTAGQSLGAFAVNGLKIVLNGDANDYVGKGLSGGIITLTPPASQLRRSQNNVILGNTCLYGATSGSLFAAGQAGERFAVRNSGAIAVVEGCGSNGCEYMTGGTVVVLGAVGHNFAAGMSGGMAFVYDADNSFEMRINKDMVVYQRLGSEYWEEVLKDCITHHIAETGSQYANNILLQWEWGREKFWQICPKDMIDRLEFNLNGPSAQDELQVMPA